MAEVVEGMGLRAIAEDESEVNRVSALALDHTDSLPVVVDIDDRIVLDFDPRVVSIAERGYATKLLCKNWERLAPRRPMTNWKLRNAHGSEVAHN
jgi:hypothetical protein